MNLHIKDIAQIEDSVRKVLHDHCSHARTLISENASEHPHETIHEVRKIFKKIRGVLRLVRDTTDEYQKWNAFFRDEARKISDIRDTTSMIEAIDLLYDQYSDKLYKNAFSGIRVQLGNERRKQEGYLKKKNALQEINQNIKTKCEALKEMPMDIDSFHDILSGIKRTYKRGRKAFNKSSESKAPEDFHEWRKRVKYLRYQVRAIVPVWPGIWEAWEDELHDLSDSLGDDRDLFMLQNFIEKTQHEVAREQGENENGDLLNTLIEGHRPLLQKQALQLGQKLYHLKPGKFVSLVEASWHAQLAMDGRTSIHME